MSRGCVEGTGSDVKRRSLEGSQNIIYGNAADMVFTDKGVNRIDVCIVVVEEEKKELGKSFLTQIEPNLRKKLAAELEPEEPNTDLPEGEILQ